MEIRKEDKMQYYTGIFQDTVTGKRECFFARFTRNGIPEDLTYLKNINH